MPRIYKHEGSIDKIVQIKLSNLYRLVFSLLNETHNSGVVTIPNCGKLTQDIVGLVEENASTIITISLE